MWAARRLLGIPFAHQGRSLFELDCAGVLVLSERLCGREPVDIPAYGNTPWKDGLRQAIQNHFGRPVHRELEAGDVLLMRHACREPQHLGIVGIHPLGVPSLIHSYAGNSARCVVEVILDQKWRNKIIEVYE